MPRPELWRERHRLSGIDDAAKGPKQELQRRLREVEAELARRSAMDEKQHGSKRADDDAEEEKVSNTTTEKPKKGEEQSPQQMGSALMATAIEAGEGAKKPELKVVGNPDQGKGDEKPQQFAIPERMSKAFLEEWVPKLNAAQATELLERLVKTGWKYRKGSLQDRFFGQLSERTRKALADREKELKERTGPKGA
jgi:hypothetical protein